MADEPIQLEDDLTEIHSFYLFLLENHFGHEIPVSGQIAHETDALRRFVVLLDLAVTPQMIRSGFRIEEHSEAAGALLRFYAQKPQRTREDRDKVDVIATTFFRALFPNYDGNSSHPEDHKAVRDFQDLLARTYAGAPMPAPPNEHVQLVRRFDFLRNEVAAFRSFDELIDSGIMQRVRGIKQSLSDSFLHPTVLSVVASYNIFFHQIFDRLFVQAAQEMRSFATKVQRDGSNMLASGEGDEYALDELSAAEREQFRQISQIRKTIENDRSVQRPTPELNAVPEPAARTKVPIDPETNGYDAPTSTLSAAEAEGKELDFVKNTIRAFVRAADAHAAHLVPLPNGNIELTDAEAEAFRTDFGDEKSFRADFAALLIEVAAIDARLRSRLEEFEKTRHTAYNWKPHADALAHLLSSGRDVADKAMELSATARERGLHDKADALNESVEKIRPRGRAAVEALQSIQPADS